MYICVCGSCSQTNINLIQMVQNQAARIVTKTYNYTVRSNTLLEHLCWMNARQRHNCYTAILLSLLFPLITLFYLLSFMILVYLVYLDVY